MLSLAACVVRLRAEVWYPLGGDRISLFSTSVCFSMAFGADKLGAMRWQQRLFDSFLVVRFIRKP